MPDGLISIAVQVSATLILGVFFGFERRLRGKPDASMLHALVASFGLLAMLYFRPQAIPGVAATAVAMALCFALIGAFRAALQAFAGQPELFADSGADTFTLGGAMSVGCACGTGEVRSVIGVMLVMACASIVRPLDQSRLPTPLARGNVDFPTRDTTPVPANDDLPSTGREDPLGR